MKKYYLKKTGEEVNFGDSIEVSLEKEADNSYFSYKTVITLNEDTVEDLKELGVIVEREISDKPSKKTVKNITLAARLSTLASKLSALLEETNELRKELYKDVI